MSGDKWTLTAHLPSMFVVLSPLLLMCWYMRPSRRVPDRSVTPHAFRAGARRDGCVDTELHSPPRLKRSVKPLTSIAARPKRSSPAVPQSRKDTDAERT